MSKDVGYIDYIKSQGLESELAKMLVLDFIVMNVDRHEKNIEVLTCTSTGAVRLAPIFDNGLSLLATYAPCAEKHLDKLDILEDQRINSFLGRVTFEQSLKVIEEPVRLKSLIDKGDIFAGMDVIFTGREIDFMWEMITTRLEYLEELGCVKTI